MKPIDFVIMWVDGNDPEWQKEKKKFTPLADQDGGALRYKDWDNLQYWFRSVEQFAPWVNKIHFVTWGHVPSWLNTAHPKLNVVRHADFISDEFLPTFSANPIELNVHRIPGLSEHFVLFNDDMFIIRDMKPQHFFAGGVPRDRIALSAVTPNDDSISAIMFNDVKVVNRHFSKRSLIKNHIGKLLFPHCGVHGFKSLMMLPFKFFTGFYNDHLPYAYTKALFEEIWEKEYEILSTACRNRFRDPSDVNQWLMRYWRLAKGDFVKCSANHGQMLSITDNNDMMFKAILKQKFYMICCNDEGDYSDFDEQAKQLRACFHKLLPQKCSYEIE